MNEDGQPDTNIDVRGATAAAPLLTLERDVLLAVFSKLDPVSLACVCCCCKAMNALASSDDLWSQLCLLRWRHNNSHLAPSQTSDSQCSWKELYGRDNGWKAPDFTVLRLPQDDLTATIQALTVVDSDFLGLGLARDQQVAITGLEALEQAPFGGCWLEVKALPATANAVQQSSSPLLTARSLLSSIASMCPVSPGRVALGGTDFTELHELSSRQSSISWNSYWPTG